jgi:ABC-2 type transport system ATP-binding protein
MSLGERMRCEVVASFLHAPSVLFLDEPTVGLDVAAKVMIRDLIHTASQEDGTTVLLTSHDTGDMERVCDRVILIDEGRIVIDDKVASLRKTYIAKKIITLQTASAALPLKMKGVTPLSTEAHRHVFEIDTSLQNVEAVIAAALKKGGLRDISVEDPPMEDVINAIYARNKKGGKAV